MTDQFGIESTVLGNQELVEDFLGNSDKLDTKPDDVKLITDDDKKDNKDNKDNKDDKKDDKKDNTPIVKTNEEVVKDLLGDDTDDNQNHDNKDDNKDNKDTKDTPPAGSDIQFENLAKDFFELGLFSKDDDDEQDVAIKTPEEFIERVQLEKKRGAIEILDNFIGRFGDDYKDAFDAIYNKGVDPKSYFQSYNEISNYTNLDLTKPENQELIVRKALHDEGYDTEDIDAKVQKLKDYSDLEDESKRVQKVVVKKEQQKLEEQVKQKEQSLRDEAEAKLNYNKSVVTILNDKIKEKDFDGIPMNINFAKDVNDFLTTDKYKLPNGKIITDFDKYILDLDRPENHNTKVNLLLLSSSVG